MTARPWLFALLTAWLVAGLAPTAHAQTAFVCPPPPFGGEASAIYYVGVGDVAFGLLDYAAAVRSYTCALERDPANTTALARRGYAYAAQRSQALAFRDFDAALALNEADAQVYTNRGVAYLAQGNIGLAIADFSVAIALAPDDPAAYNNRAIAYAAEGSFDEAIADLATALQIDPRYAPAHASLGATYTALAARSYQTYRQIAGANVVLLPPRQPVEIIRALDEDGRIRRFEVWLQFLTPAAPPLPIANTGLPADPLTIEPDAPIPPPEGAVPPPDEEAPPATEDGGTS